MDESHFIIKCGWSGGGGTETGFSRWQRGAATMGPTRGPRAGCAPPACHPLRKCQDHVYTKWGSCAPCPSVGRKCLNCIKGSCTGRGLTWAQCRQLAPYLFWLRRGRSSNPVASNVTPVSLRAGVTSVVWITALEQLFTIDYCIGRWGNCLKRPHSKSNANHLLKAVKSGLTSILTSS